MHVCSNVFQDSGQGMYKSYLDPFADSFVTRVHVNSVSSNPLSPRSEIKQNYVGRKCSALNPNANAYGPVSFRDLISSETDLNISNNVGLDTSPSFHDPPIPALSELNEQSVRSVTDSSNFRTGKSFSGPTTKEPHYGFFLVLPYFVSHYLLIVSCRLIFHSGNHYA